jgi:hypothetical protein
MSRFFQRIFAFVDEFLEIFDEELLMWCSILVFLVTSVIGLVFFAAMEGFIGGAALAIALHMFVSDWKHAAPFRRPCRKRAHAVLIDIRGINFYPPASSTPHPPKGGYQ